MKITCFGLFLGAFATAVNGETVADFVGNNTDLTTLYAAVEAAGLLDMLSTDEVTLFAPVDEAFAALPNGTVEALLTPPYLAHLQFLLAQHVIPGVVASSNITDGLTVATTSGPLSFSTTDEGVFVDGGDLYQSEVVEPDVAADNGVVHVVDQVILPVELVRSTWENLQNTSEGYEVLKEFLIETGLDAALDGNQTLTIFAPSDAVFSGISDEDLASLNITEVLFNHAVSGVLPSSLLTDGMVVTTLLGVNYTVTVTTDGDNETVLIGGIPVTQANLISMNGITHVLGGLLLPPVEGEAPVVPPTLAPVVAPSDGSEAPAAGGNVFTPAPTVDAESSASKVGSIATLVASCAALLL